MVPDSGLGKMQTQIKVTAPIEKCSCNDYFSVKFNVQHTGKYSIKYELFFTLLVFSNILLFPSLTENN